MDFLFSFVVRVYKRWGGRGLVLFAVGAVAGAVVGLSTFGSGVYQLAKWQAHEFLASANKRAETAEATSADANKRASDANTALQEQKAKYDEELSSVKAQLQALKKNAALQKQTLAKRPKNPVLSDLFGDDEWFILKHKHQILVNGRYIVLATPNERQALFGGFSGCTLTVTNVDTNEKADFNFAQGKSGVLSIGETKVALILMSANAVDSRSEVCAFQQRQ